MNTFDFANFPDNEKLFQKTRVPFFSTNIETWFPYYETAM